MKKRGSLKLKQERPNFQIADVRVINDRETPSTALAYAVTIIGSRIRELRNHRGLTLQELAVATALSPSMLSLVERGRTSPSIGSLVVIANALDVTLSDLVLDESNQDERVVVRANTAMTLETPDHVLCRALKEDRIRGVSVTLNEYVPGTASEVQPHIHEGYEYGYVLQGRLTIELDTDTYELGPGDFVAFESKRRHRFCNRGNKRVKALWFNLRHN